MMGSDIKGYQHRVVWLTGPMKDMTETITFYRKLSIGIHGHEGHKLRVIEVYG